MGGGRCNKVTRLIERGKKLKTKKVSMASNETQKIRWKKN